MRRLVPAILIVMITALAAATAAPYGDAVSAEATIGMGTGGTWGFAIDARSGPSGGARGLGDLASPTPITTDRGPPGPRAAVAAPARPPGEPPRRQPSLPSPSRKDRLSPGSSSRSPSANKARDAGIAVSMGSRGDADDNAVAESFFATLKKELIRWHSWPTRRELIGEVFDYIEAFYNPTRRHSTLGSLSPGAVRASRCALRAQANDHQGEHDLTNRVHRDGGTPLRDVRRRHTVDRWRTWVSGNRCGPANRARADSHGPPPSVHLDFAYRAGGDSRRAMV